jgi:hypothetical protein
MSWHSTLDQLRAEFLEEVDAILGGTEDKELRSRYAAEIHQKAVVLEEDLRAIQESCLEQT